MATTTTNLFPAAQLLYDIIFFAECSFELGNNLMYTAAASMKKETVVLPSAAYPLVLCHAAFSIDGRLVFDGLCSLAKTNC